MAPTWFDSGTQFSIDEVDAVNGKEHKLISSTSMYFDI
jgi:hypothetical protein